MNEKIDVIIKENIKADDKKLGDSILIIKRYSNIKELLGYAKLTKENYNKIIIFLKGL